MGHLRVGDRGVLLVPQGEALQAPPFRAVVAWDATPAALRATHGALPSTRRAAKTLGVAVTEDKALRPG